MTKALLDPSRCRPDQCPGGECAIRRICPVRAISQEEPLETPLFDWGRCHACSRCVAGCPQKAISLVS